MNGDRPDEKGWIERWYRVAAALAARVGEPAGHRGAHPPPHPAGQGPFWLIVVGSLVLAVRRRARGPIPGRSWWWLTVPVLEGAFRAYVRTLLPAAHAPVAHAPAVNVLIPQPPIMPPTSVIALSTLPVVVTMGFVLLALRATVAIGDPRWAIATGVYLVPLGVFAAAIVYANPSGIVTLGDQLPVVLLAASIAMVMLRRSVRRAGD